MKTNNYRVEDIRLVDIGTVVKVKDLLSHIENDIKKIKHAISSINV